MPFNGYDSYFSSCLKLTAVRNTLIVTFFIKFMHKFDRFLKFTADNCVFEVYNQIINLFWQLSEHVSNRISTTRKLMSQVFWQIYLLVTY